LLAAGAGQASTLDVTVPFPFDLQGKPLPAGRYRVTNEEGVVRFCGEHRLHECVNVLTSPASGVDPKGSAPAVTFTRGENGYRVSDIWMSESDGRAVTPDHAHHSVR
jgi:hypothetical protein